MPRKGRTLLIDLVRPFLWVYVRLLHRLRFEHWQCVPREIGPEGLIVVANHTAALDPVLQQVRLGASIRWMMDRTQMSKLVWWFWRWARVIPVDFKPSDVSAFRDALAHLRGGGVIGVFPEGGIERPPREIRPFLDGVGALVRRSRAPVLVLWLHGEPSHQGILRSLVTPSRSVVTVVGVYRFDSNQCARGIRDITEHLRRELSRASGWPLNDTPLLHLAGMAARERST